MNKEFSCFYRLKLKAFIVFGVCSVISWILLFQVMNCILLQLYSQCQLWPFKHTQRTFILQAKLPGSHTNSYNLFYKISLSLSLNTHTHTHTIKVLTGWVRHQTFGFLVSAPPTPPLAWVRLDSEIKLFLKHCSHDLNLGFINPAVTMFWW